MAFVSEIAHTTGAYLKSWWEGEFEPPDNDNDSGLFFLMGHHRPHWSARVCHAALKYALENHRWLIGTAIAIAGLVIAMRHHAAP